MDKESSDKEKSKRETECHLSANFLLLQVSQYTFAMCSYREKKSEPQELMQLEGYTVDYTEPHPGIFQLNHLTCHWYSHEMLINILYLCRIGISTQQMGCIFHWCPGTRLYAVQRIPFWGLLSFSHNSLSLVSQYTNEIYESYVSIDGIFHTISHHWLHKLLY